jgi:hypothetical protein
VTTVSQGGVLYGVAIVLLVQRYSSGKDKGNRERAIRDYLYSSSSYTFITPATII